MKTIINPPFQLGKKRGRKPKYTAQNILQSDSTMKCLLLAALGFSYKYIGHSTGLTRSEIGIRLQKVGIKCKMYRDGTSQIAKRVLNQTDQYVEAALQKRLAKQPLILTKQDRLEIQVKI